MYFDIIKRIIIIFQSGQSDVVSTVLIAIKNARGRQ